MKHHEAFFHSFINICGKSGFSLERPKQHRCRIVVCLRNSGRRITTGVCESHACSQVLQKVKSGNFTFENKEILSVQ